MNNEPKKYKNLTNNHILFLAELTKEEHLSDYFLVDQSSIFPSEKQKVYYPNNYLATMEIVSYAINVKDKERAERIKHMVETYESYGNELRAIN